MRVVPTVLFTLCGFVTLWYATTFLGFGLWVLAPTLMLLIVGPSLRVTQLADIAKATAMAASVITGIFVFATVVAAIVRGSAADLVAAAPLLVGLICLSGLGVLVGRGPASS